MIAALGEMVRTLCGLSPAALVGKPGGEIWPPLLAKPADMARFQALLAR